MQARRLWGAAAVLRSGVCAGTMESSSGRARPTPMPRRIVRRERCFLVMYMLSLNFFRSTHLKRSALHDAKNKCREAVVLLRRLRSDGAYCRHVTIIDHTAEAIRQQVLRKFTENLLSY